MAENLEIDCKDCNATFRIKHSMNVSRYEIGVCAFCGGEDIEIEEGFEEEDEEDYY